MKVKLVQIVEAIRSSQMRLGSHRSLISKKLIMSINSGNLVTLIHSTIAGWKSSPLCSMYFSTSLCFIKHQLSGRLMIRCQRSRVEFQMTPNIKWGHLTHTWWAQSWSKLQKHFGVVRWHSVFNVIDCINYWTAINGIDSIVSVVLGVLIVSIVLIVSGVLIVLI